MSRPEIVRSAVGLLLGLSAVLGGNAQAQAGKAGPPPGRVTIRDSLEGHKHPVWCVGFADGGKTLVSCAAAAREIYRAGGEGEIKLWDVATRKGIGTIAVPRASQHWAVSPDGKAVAVAVTGTKRKLPNRKEYFPIEKVEIYDLAAGKKTQALGVAEHTIEVRLTFSPGGKLLACAESHLGSGSQVQLWSLAARKRVGTLTAGLQHISGVALSPDGTMLASAGSYDGAQLWDVGSGDNTHTFEDTYWQVRSRVDKRKQKRSARSVAFSPDGKSLAVGFEGFEKFLGNQSYEHNFITNVILGGVASGKPVKTLADSSRTRCTEAMAFSKDGKILAVVTCDEHVTERGGGYFIDKYAGKVKLWNVGTGKLLITLGLHDGKVNGVAFSPDGKTFATAGMDKTAKLWELPARAHTFPKLTLYNPAVSGGAVGPPDGKAITTGPATWTLRMAPVGEGRTRAYTTYRLRLNVQKNTITGHSLDVPRKEESEFTGEVLVSGKVPILWMKQTQVRGDYRAVYSGKQVGRDRFSGAVHDVRGRVWEFKLTADAKK